MTESAAQQGSSIFDASLGLAPITMVFAAKACDQRLLKDGPRQVVWASWPKMVRSAVQQDTMTCGVAIYARGPWPMAIDFGPLGRDDTT